MIMQSRCKCRRYNLVRRHFAMSTFVTEVSVYVSGASILLNPKGMDMGDNIMTLINHRDPIGSITNIKPAKVNHMPDHKEGELYVIKVQAGSRDCLIYDRQRSFTTMVSDPREQAALRPVITSVNHRGGAKAYMYAKNEGNQFRVYLEDLPEQYVNW